MTFAPQNIRILKDKESFIIAQNQLILQKYIGKSSWRWRKPSATIVFDKIPKAVWGVEVLLEYNEETSWRIADNRPKKINTHEVKKADIEEKYYYETLEYNPERPKPPHSLYLESLIWATTKGAVGVTTLYLQDNKAVTVALFGQIPKPNSKEWSVELAAKILNEAWKIQPPKSIYSSLHSFAKMYSAALEVCGLNSTKLFFVDGVINIEYENDQKIQKISITKTKTDSRKIFLVNSETEKNKLIENINNKQLENEANDTDELDDENISHDELTQEAIEVSPLESINETDDEIAELDLDDEETDLIDDADEEYESIRENDNESENQEDYAEENETQNKGIFGRFFGRMNTNY